MSFGVLLLSCNRNYQVCGEASNKDYQHEHCNERLSKNEEQKRAADEDTGKRNYCAYELFLHKYQQRGYYG
jgi:hypothetical protein